MTKLLLGAFMLFTIMGISSALTAGLDQNGERAIIPDAPPQTFQADDAS